MSNRHLSAAAGERKNQGLEWVGGTGTLNATTLFRMCAQYKLKNSEVEMIVPKGIFDTLLRAALQNVPLDEAWYLGKYSDVSPAIDEGKVASAKNHYITVGYFENRLPFAIKVDDNFYLENNSDVAAALEAGGFKTAQEHFDLYGFAEGRVPYAGFSLFGS